jgi:hypothetical protein
MLARRRCGGVAKEASLFYLDLAGCIQAISLKLFPHPKFGASNVLFSINTEARAFIHRCFVLMYRPTDKDLIPTVSPAECPFTRP